MDPSGRGHCDCQVTCAISARDGGSSSPRTARSTARGGMALAPLQWTLTLMRKMITADPGEPLLYPSSPLRDLATATSATVVSEHPEQC